VVDNISSQIMSLLIILLSCCRILSSRFFWDDKYSNYKNCNSM
jgi:hypothetical protein